MALMIRRTEVSSRAPVWGHPVDDAITEIADGFKSCPRVGGIIALPYAVSRDAKSFQVVPPVWGHPMRRGRIPKDSCFKSCPRVGASIQRFGKNALILVFQVVPRVGHPAITLAHRWQSYVVSKSCPRVGASGLLRSPLRADLVFKSCPRVGASSREFALRRPRRRFKSCPRVGGIANRMLTAKTRVSVFKSCPRGGHPPIWRRLPRTVSSRAPVGGHRKVCCLGAGGCGFQVVPPCGASIVHHLGTIFSRVSSRAPVWGIRKNSPLKIREKFVSSRAPVWGASIVPVRMTCFDPVSSRAPCGGI